MSKNILFGIGGLILGLAIGFFASNNVNRNAATQQNLSNNPTDAPFFNQPTVSVKEPQTTSGMLPDVAETLEKAKKEPEKVMPKLEVIPASEFFS